MIRAELEYKTDTIDKYFQHSHLCFFGDKNPELINKLEYLRDFIKNDKCDINEIRIQGLQKDKDSIITELFQKQQDIETFKKENLLWMLKKELRIQMQILQAEYNSLVEKNTILDSNIQMWESDKTYSASVLTDRFKNMLANLEFKCVTTLDGNRKTEIYESVYNEEELLVLVTNYIQQLENKYNNELQYVKSLYGNPEENESIIGM